MNEKYFKQTNISVIFIQKYPLTVRFMYKQGTFDNKLYCFRIYSLMLKQLVLFLFLMRLAQKAQ